MRLAWHPVPPVRLSAVPAASVALLLIAIFSIAEMGSAVRGIGLEFPSGPNAAALPPDDSPAVIVAVDRVGSIRIDGAAVGADRLVEELRLALTREPEAVVVFFVAPEAPYSVMADVVGRVVASADDEQEGPRLDRLSIPTHRQVAEYVAAHGKNPFEDLP